MSKYRYFLLATLLIISCQNAKPTFDLTDTWANAKWIAFEQMEDSLKVVPAVHGSGDELGERCIKRSIIPLFRKDFKVPDYIESAIINISGMGHYELHINGSKVGNSFLSPGWSYYQKHELYNTYDITEQVKKGENALGVLVGNGFYYINRERYRKIVLANGYPKLIFNLTLKLRDGSNINIVSDKGCKVSPSPITYSSIFGGEDYDATLEQAGWDSYGFDDSSWNDPIILKDSVEKLILENDFPLKVMQEFSAVKILKSKTGRTIYDFGQNASGIISLKVKGSKGTKIRILPDELINEQRNVTQRSGGGPYEFNYTLKGEGEETWQPRFTYYGFRYADVEIIEQDKTDVETEILDLKLLHTRNSSPTVGSFSCSDTLFNQIFDLINWGIKSNMASVATDCPHREKLGWLEQTYLIGPSMHYNFNIHKLYSKIVDDMIDSQLEDGLVPDIAPEYVPFQGGFRDSPEWGSASVIIPWLIYNWYGDVAILRKAYPMMKRYINYLQHQAQDNILDYGLGDWFDLGPKRPGVAQLTPKGVTATSIYYYDLSIVTKVAELFGHEDDLKHFKRLSSHVKEAFIKKYYNRKNAVCSTGSQTAYAMALYTGILPDEDKERILKNLVDNIIKNDYALTSGDIGYHFLVRVLSENGRSDILYKMNNRTDRPGYGFQLKKGATSLTESWAALADVSNNHMMLGHLMEWFYTGLGGIYQDEGSIAYNNIIIAPKPVGNINWVKCNFHSAKGLISSAWKKTKDNFTLVVEIPPDASAKVILPEVYTKSSVEVIDVNSKNQVQVTMEGVTFEITSGKYRVTVK